MPTRLRYESQYQGNLQRRAPVQREYSKKTIIIGMLRANLRSTNVLRRRWEPFEPGRAGSTDGRLVLHREQHRRARSTQRPPSRITRAMTIIGVIVVQCNRRRQRSPSDL
jgi:hypothetical protein